MFRQSPSRNNRSRGFKVKHVLQICLLLAVCFWLIYQVKHSHDKKKEFDANDAEISVRAQNDNEVLKFGRKDLHPRVGETTIENEKRKEDEEETEAEEEDQEGEGKLEKKEDEGRGDGDDEIDENDQEKTEGESYREEDSIDDEKDREEEGDEKEGEEKEDQFEHESLSEEQDHDGGGRNTHEAREEHYRGDDASSAVAHDTQTISTETENMMFENQNENELNILEQNNKFNGNEVNTVQNISGPIVAESERAGNGTSLDRITFEEKGNQTSLSNTGDGSFLNSTFVTESNSPPQASYNLTDGKIETHDSSLVKQTDTLLDLTRSQNATVEGTSTGENSSLQIIVQEQANSSNAISINNQPDSNSTISSKTGNADVARSDTASEGDSSSSSATKENIDGTQTKMSDTSNMMSVRPDPAAEAEDRSGVLATKENADATQSEKLETLTTMDGKDEGSGFSSTNENTDAVQQDPIDSSDSSIPQYDKNAHTDSETLLKIRMGGSDSEDAAAE
ncbi:uncharacterized protein LOC131163924 [Malania oleifera]|uniref:uncharacterized protein LOC131163924 n=1 Tax=Malania oleifera TaxID=397392 RepID=UPI0025ADB2E0|nr:uncharacterized protein LOC131163924 [Malania oleifera]XP_057976738.1 uncharacterized protein LOC131163924 [Malania oleifera]XP_057976739.1 uncharacterized protein LOC131163924 [Malania oleifera]XP_057976740.1 uncharacterized protein LOC131163924 [Malania oleifera]